MALYYQYKILRGTLEEIERKMCEYGNQGFGASANGKLEHEGLGIYTILIARSRSTKENDAYHGYGPYPLDNFPERTTIGGPEL